MVEEASGIDCKEHVGTVEVRKGARLEDVDANLVSVGYTGTRCDECHWYQFVWREIVVHTKDGHAKPKSGHVTTTGGSYDLTTDVNKPNWNPDSASPTDPSYEAAGLSRRTGDSDTIFDAPGGGIDAFAGTDKTNSNVFQISSSMHGETFLVCDGKVCAHVIWSVFYNWTRADNRTSGPEYAALPVETSGKPPNDDQKKAINAKYPSQGVF